LNETQNKNNHQRVQNNTKLTVSALVTIQTPCYGVKNIRKINYQKGKKGEVCGV